MSAYSHPSVIPEDRSRFHVFLLMGQSNMAGYGCVDTGDPWQPGDKDPVPGVLVLDGQCLPDNPGLDPASPMQSAPGAHPLHLRQATAQFGLGMDFAKRYRAAHPDITVGLIPAAWGGAAIDTLSKGSILYGNTIDRAHVALLRGTLKGVLWHQGESDTVAADLANAYAWKLCQLVKDLRQDLSLPELIFVCGNLAEFYGTGPGNNDPQRVRQVNTVRAALRSLPEQDDQERPSWKPRGCVHRTRTWFILTGRPASPWASATQTLCSESRTAPSMDGLLSVHIY